ncbi:MAG TPA: acyltransferase [Chloroflexota bacterium]|nr:acyltransferase [Chloroflexota bacterium]
MRSDRAGPRELRLPALDGLRGVAIILVILFHGFQVSENSPTLLDRVVEVVPRLGWSGVTLFFVLSGFLITGILVDARGRPGYFRVFYARRILRILPLYYTVLLLAFVVAPHVPAFQHALGLDGPVPSYAPWYWLYLSNLLLAAHGGAINTSLDVTWSLSIEEQFYLLWPLVVLACPRDRLAKVCLGLVALALAWRVGLAVAGADSGSYFLTLGHVDSLGAGAFLAVAWRARGRLWPALVRWAPRAGLLSGAWILGLYAVRSLGPDLPGLAATGPFYYTAWTLLYGAALVLALQPGSLRRVLEVPVLRTFGRYSYALYLLHQPVLLLVARRLYQPEHFMSLWGSPLPGMLIYLALSTAIVFGCAWLSWHLLEAPLLGLKRHFRYAANETTFDSGEADHGVQPESELDTPTLSQAPVPSN